MRLLIIGDQNLKFSEMHKTPPSYRTGAYICDFFLYEDLSLFFSLQPLAPAIQIIFLDPLGQFNNPISI